MVWLLYMFVQPLPRHVAIIPDGNGRWAKLHGFGRSMGHRRGFDPMFVVINACIELGIKYLTFYVFSTENWGRPHAEVMFLMQFLGQMIDCKLDTLMDLGIRLVVIGDTESLSQDLRTNIERAVDKTKDNSALVLNLAINYGGRQEIVHAAKELARDVLNFRVCLDDVDETYLLSKLYMKFLPYPDLLIRTGGERRISNLLLWHMAYTEMYFCDVLWPDFDYNDFLVALIDYSKRSRRYGVLSDI